MIPFQIKELKKALTERYKLLIFKGNQKQVAKEIEGERISLGAEYNTPKVNLTVKPVGKSADNYDWPRHF